MKKKPLLKIVLAASLLFAVAESAALAQIEIQMAEVGHAGNAPDSNSQGYRNGYGSVGYNYQIGIYEVTNAEYTAFLNSAAQSDPYGLYNENMGTGDHGGISRSGVDGSYTYATRTGHENRPVVFVHLSNAMHFSNWLTNGQGSGSITSGSYDMSLSIRDAAERMAPAAPGQVQYFVANQHEWYKAAYFDPTLNDGEGGYWAYATQSDTAPSPAQPGATVNGANLNRRVARSTDVGAYTASYSFYGLFDLEGNVSEFTDTVQANNDRWVRRGPSNYGNNLTGAANMGADPFTTQSSVIGFRLVAVTAIPEPSSVVMLTAAGIGLVAAKGSFRKRD